MLQLPSALRRQPVDPVERTMRELSQQGTGMARLAHIFATLMVILFSLGSLVALSGESFAAIVATVQHGGVPSVPQAISIAVSTLMVVCCDIGLVYAAMTLRVLKTRGAEEGATLHWIVLVGVSIIEAGTYLYMSRLYEHPTGLAWALVVARALAAPLLSVYLAMARAHPVTPRDILHQAELAQGIQLVRDVIRVARDPAASLADKMRLYEASAEMGERDKSRLQQMITVVQARLAVPSDALLTPRSQDAATDQTIPNALPHMIEDPSVVVGPALEESDEEDLDEVFAPRGRYNAGRVTARIEAPSGELVEGRHPAAWPYELWQRMVEAKAGQYRRPHAAVPGVAVQPRAHEFSRMIVCAGCQRPLRVTPSKGVSYYKDTSSVRKLPCPHFGCLSVKAATVVRQFGDVLASVTLPNHWREAVAARCEEAVGTGDAIGRRAQLRRTELDAEQRRLVAAFAKGYLAEADLDAQIERLRAELATLPLPVLRDAGECTHAAIAAGETLADMAGYWNEAAPEDRRDMVWALLQLGGLTYDLEHQVIVGLQLRPDMLPVLSLALEAEWEQREEQLWLREEHRATRAARRPVRQLQAHPPFHAHVLTSVQREEALELLRAGRSPQQVADAFGVSYWVILRLLKRTEPKMLPQQQQPVLSSAQADEARALLATGLSLRQVGKHFGVSYGAIWRLVQRDRARESVQHGEGTHEGGGAMG